MHPAVKAAKMSTRLRDAGLIGTAKPKLYDYKHFHGLVVMVNFNDRKFSRTDAHAVFDSIVCGRNFKGFKDAVKDSIIPYTGSVCDYFRDNSAGSSTLNSMWLVRLTSITVALFRMERIALGL
jgi:hypothetical protein